jgi:hypothetical protein
LHPSCSSRLSYRCEIVMARYSSRLLLSDTSRWAISLMRYTLSTRDFELFYVSFLHQPSICSVMSFCIFLLIVFGFSNPRQRVMDDCGSWRCFYSGKASLEGFILASRLPWITVTRWHLLLLQNISIINILSRMSPAQWTRCIVLRDLLSCRCVHLA